MSDVRKETSAGLPPKAEAITEISFTIPPPASGIKPGSAMNSAILRPGISAETLFRAGVRHVGADEAFTLCGMRASGIWIPYFYINGNPIVIDGKPYGRLRLDNPRQDQKYHQESGSGCHPYMPSMLNGKWIQGQELFLTEGEFKTLALSESGYQTIGLPGFYGYSDGEILPELAEALDFLKPSSVLFIGDSDTCFNFRFPVAAVRLAKLIAPIPLMLPRLPLTGPKGVDDVKETLR